MTQVTIRVLTPASRVGFGTRYRRHMFGTVLTQDAGYLVWCYHKMPWFRKSCNRTLRLAILRASRMLRKYEKLYGIAVRHTFGVAVAGFPKPVQHETYDYSYTCWQPDDVFDDGDEPFDWGCGPGDDPIG